jgi:F-box/leucine-rich repeat protein 14
MLMAQGSVAGDDGFESLSRSQTIEHIWGRECPNLHGRGFAALARMPALKGLAVSCKNVDDASLATLTQFPALTWLTPIDVSDAGFRHIGRCAQLERLTCMYCRDTGDAATEHIAGLSKLRHYHATQTRITDRSLKILGGIDSLEEVELSACTGISNAGLAHVARLPRLRKVAVDATARVTRDGLSVFPPNVHVDFWT